MGELVMLGLLCLAPVVLGVIALVVVLVARANRVPCVYCGERIPKGATLCRFCGREVPPAEAAAPAGSEPPASS